MGGFADWGGPRLARLPFDLVRLGYAAQGQLGWIRTGLFPNFGALHVGHPRAFIDLTGIGSQTALLARCINLGLNSNPNK